MYAAYETPLFAPTDPLVCRVIQLRPQLWSVLFNELQRLGQEWSWRQDDPTHATIAEVIGEINNATDSAVFAACTMIGEVKFITTAIPTWCLLCDGAEYDESEYPELFAVIDDAYKTGADTFVVPDLIDRFALGSTVPASEGGESEHTLTIGEMPAHTHGEQDPGLVTVDVTVPTATALSDPGLPSQTGSTGGGNPHNNMPPYHTLIPVIVAAYPEV